MIRRGAEEGPLLHPDMSGLLSDHPLAELIHEVSGERLSGALRLSRARAKGAIYFEGGKVSNALTNLRAYRLTEALQENGAVDAEKLRALVQHGMSEEAAGADLISAGLLSAEELKRFRERLAAEVLRYLLKWDDGEWLFEPRVRLADGQRFSVETEALLVESARRLSPEFASKSFSDPTEKLSPAAPAASIDAVPLLPTEAFVLSRIDATLSLDDLVAVSGLPEAETRRAVYVLVLGGLVRRERPKRALPADVIARASTMASRALTEPAMSIATGATKTGGSAEDRTLEEAPELARDPREELAELFARAERSSFYEILGVGQTAKAEEIKRSYYALARRFHPDRFRRHADESELPRVELSFAKIAQAHEILKDPSQRAAYDLKLKNQPSTTSPQPQGTKTSAPPSDSRADATLRRAEEVFQQGLAALKQNDRARASKCFSEAALLVPQQARYRAFFGQVLAREKTTRRQAEAELQAAIVLDARNVTYRVMLAELYRDVGMRRRAESELEQALLIDRAHDVARRMLDEIRRA